MNRRHRPRGNALIIPGDDELFSLKAAPLRVLAEAYGIEYQNKGQAVGALEDIRRDAEE
jgi:hypothetical protein